MCSGARPGGGERGRGYRVEGCVCGREGEGKEQQGSQEEAIGGVGGVGFKNQKGRILALA